MNLLLNWTRIVAARLLSEEVMEHLHAHYCANFKVSTEPGQNETPAIQPTTHECPLPEFAFLGCNQIRQCLNGRIPNTTYHLNRASAGFFFSERRAPRRRRCTRGTPLAQPVERGLRSPETES